MTPPISQQDALDMLDSNFEDLLLSQIKRSDRNESIWDVLVSDAVRFRTQNLIDRMLTQAKAVLKAKNLHLEEVIASCDDPATGGSSEWRSERLAAIKSRNASERFLRLIRETHEDIRRHSAYARKARRDAERAPAATPPLAQPSRAEGGVRRALPALQLLVAGVIEHEEEMADDPSEADEELWGHLDEVTVVVGGERVTLRQAHDSDWKAGKKNGSPDR